MNKKLFSRIFALLMMVMMLVSLVPPAFADGGKDAVNEKGATENNAASLETDAVTDNDKAPLIIDVISLVGPKAPATGDTVSAYTAESEKYSAAGSWLRGDEIADETEFKAETVYSLSVALTAKEGYAFKTELKVKLDGEDMTVITDSDGNVSFVKTYTATDKAGNTAVARIIRDGKNIDFESFDEAYKAAADGEEILLLKSCATQAGINLDKNISVSALEGLETKPVLTFAQYGMALWGKSIVFSNIDIVMNGIGSTPYTAEWGWMTVCGQSGSAITLNNVTMTMDGTGTASNTHAIYADNGMQLNLNSSALTIKNYGQDALEWNGGGFDYNVNLVNSSYNAAGNRSGFTGTFKVKAVGSTINVNNNRGNGSNGSHFELVNSTVNFNNNGSHGLSAGNLSMDNSTVTANGNGGNGVHVTGTLTVKNNTVLTIQNNICKISSKWTKPGALLIAGDGSIAGSKVTITGNSGSGIHQINNKTLTVEAGTELTVTGNKAVKLGYGGGIAAAGAVKLPENAVIYNNHASIGGDDIALYSDTGSISLGPVGADWSLDGTEGTNDCLKAIDGWYIDKPDAPATEEAPAVNGRWNAHSLEKLNVTEVAPGSISAPAFLKAAHGITLNETYKAAEINFIKVDSATGEPVKDAEFGLYSDEACKDKLASYKSDAKGEFTVSQLAGEYYLKETKAAPGYKNSDRVYRITVVRADPQRSNVLDTEAIPNEVVENVIYNSVGSVADMEAREDGRYCIENEAVLQVSLSKVWVDKNNGKLRSSSVEVSLRANGREIERYTLSDANGWKEYLELPVYDENGKEIKYSIKELTKLKDYNASYDGFTVYNTLNTLSPKTGDDNSTLLWAGILCFSALAFAGAAFVLIRKKRTEN